MTTRVSELPCSVFAQPILIISEKLKSLSVAQAIAGIVIKTLWGVSWGGHLCNGQLPVTSPQLVSLTGSQQAEPLAISVLPQHELSVRPLPWPCRTAFGKHAPGWPRVSSWKSLTVNARGRPGSNRECWRAIPAGCWGQRASWFSPHTMRWYGRGWVHGQHNRPPNSVGSQASCGKQGIKETQTFFPQIHNKKSLIWSSDLMPTGNKAQLCSWKTMALQRGSSGAAMASRPYSRTFWGKRWACTICGHLPHVAAPVQTTFKHNSSKAAIIWWAGWEGS